MPRRNLSDAQKDAGNYRKPKVRVHGMEISVENPKGSIRSGVDRSGKPWAIRMTCAYGYFLGTKAGDGDHLDVFLGPDRSSEIVFVVNQISPGDGKFDEHKVMLGFRTIAEAKAAYLSNYSPGWKGLGSIVPVTLPKFKAWAFSGKKLRDPLPVDFRALLMPRLLTEFAKPFSGYTPSRHAKTGGLNDNFREKYNRENGSNLKRPVTKEPSKLDPNGKAAGRRKSFCGRMSGVPGPTSKGGELTPKGAALKRWNCQSSQTSTDFAMSKPATADLTDLEARIGRLIDFATPSNRVRYDSAGMPQFTPTQERQLREDAKLGRSQGAAAAPYVRGALAAGATAGGGALLLRKAGRNSAWGRHLGPILGPVNGPKIASGAPGTGRIPRKFSSRRPTTDFQSSVDRSGGYVTIRDAQGNERKFRQPGVLNAIKRNPVKSAIAGVLGAGALTAGAGVAYDAATHRAKKVSAMPSGRWTDSMKFIPRQ